MSGYELLNQIESDLVWGHRLHESDLPSIELEDDPEDE